MVRDKSVHEEVVNNIISFALSNGFSVLDLEYSPIKGPEGNIEYLVHIKKTDDPIRRNQWIFIVWSRPRMESWTGNRL